MNVELLTSRTEIGKSEMDQVVSMQSGIRDNRPGRGTVASFPEEKIHPGAKLSLDLSCMSACCHFDAVLHHVEVIPDGTPGLR